MLRANTRSATAVRNHPLTEPHALPLPCSPRCSLSRACSLEPRHLRRLQLFHRGLAPGFFCSDPRPVRSERVLCADPSVRHNRKRPRRCQPGHADSGRHPPAVAVLGPVRGTRPRVHRRSGRRRVPFGAAVRARNGSLYQVKPIGADISSHVLLSPGPVCRGTGRLVCRVSFETPSGSPTGALGRRPSTLRTA